MRVYLIRHGEAEDGASDSQRPLSRQGREDVTRVAGFLSLFEQPRPSRIVHSDKLRARQTAQMFAEAWQVGDVREMPDLRPESDPVAWASRLASPDAGSMALVGHLPYMGRLAGLLLCGNDSRDIMQFQTASVVCLERNGRGWTALWHLHPRLFYSGD